MTSFTWNAYRDAVIRGDLEYVQRHQRHFSVFLTEERTAADLAAQKGHLDIVDLFINSAKYLRPGKLLRVLQSVLCNASKCGQLRVVLAYIDKFEATLNNSDHDTLDRASIDRSLDNIYRAAVASNRLDVLKAISKFRSRNYHATEPLTYDQYSKQLIGAFNTGSAEILQFVIDEFQFEVKDSYMPVFEIFFHAALGNVEKIRQELEENAQWYVVSETTDVGNCDPVWLLDSFNGMDGETFPGMRLVGMAARFGHLEMVKIMLEKLERLNSPIVWKQTLDEVLKQAWSTDQIEVVKWLRETGKVILKPVHQYPHLGRFGRNRVYEYVDHTCSFVDDGTLRQSNTAPDCLAITSEKNLEIVPKYLPFVNRCGLHSLLSSCVRNDCSIIAHQVCSYLPNFSCPGSHMVYDFAFSCNDYYMKQMPIVALLETLLLKTPRGSTCPCGSKNLLSMILGADGEAFEEDDYQAEDPVFFETYLYTSLYTIRILLEHGAVFTSDIVSNLIREAMLLDHSFNTAFHVVAKVAAVPRYIDITALNPNPMKLENEACMHFFASQRREKDIILLSLLSQLWGCADRQVTFPGLLCYINQLDKNHRASYFTVINSNGLVITDPFLDDFITSGTGVLCDDFDAIKNLRHFRVPSLKNMIRYNLYRRLRQRQTRLGEQRRIVDMIDLLENFTNDPDIKSLPRPLPEFLGPVTFSVEMC